MSTQPEHVLVAIATQRESADSRQPVAWLGKSRFLGGEKGTPRMSPFWADYFMLTLKEKINRLNFYTCFIVIEIIAQVLKSKFLVWNSKLEQKVLSFNCFEPFWNEIIAFLRFHMVVLVPGGTSLVPGGTSTSAWIRALYSKWRPFFDTLFLRVKGLLHKFRSGCHFLSNVAAANYAWA